MVAGVITDLSSISWPGALAFSVLAICVTAVIVALVRG